MKILSFLFIFSITVSIKSYAGDYVEDFGKKGWLSVSFDFQDRVENFLGNGHYCQKSSKSELEEVYLKLKRVTLVDPSSLESVKNYDSMVEEFTFLETAKRVEDFTICQSDAFKSLFNDKSKLDNLNAYSFNEFQIIEFTLREIDLEVQNAKEDFDKNNISTDSKFDNLSGNGEFIRNVKTQKRKIWNDLVSIRSVLIARIPFGNRPEMRASILKLIQEHGVVTQSVFQMNYLNILSLLSSQARTSKRFFEGIQVRSQTKLHRIEEDLKKSLVQTGQMKNSLNLMNLSTKVETDIMCRMDSRYKKGPSTRQIAEIPFYFAGAYGLGRLAIFASAKALGSIALSARVAMIGLEIYEISTIVDEAAQACFQDEFIAHTQNTCSAESELNITYQEASLAQCITMSALAAAPVAISGGLRVRSAGGISGVTNKVTEVLVEANKRINFFISKSDARFIRTGLEERKLLGSEAVDLDVFNGLSPKQKIYLLEDKADIALSQVQAEKLLSRSSKGEATKSLFDQDLRFDLETVRALLRLNGKDKSEIETILIQLEMRGLTKGGASKVRTDIRKILNDNPSLKSSLAQNELRIKSLVAIKQQEKISAILKEAPENMKTGFREALQKMGDQSFLAGYIRALQEETALKMIKASNQSLVDAAKAGKLDREVMANIVKTRVTGQGRKITIVRDELDSKEFNQLIGRGYIIDIAFDGTTHGKYSHLLQQDMIYGVIMKKSNISYDELRGFFGTRSGQRVWDDMFDGFGDNALSPEWFQSNIIVPSFR